VYHVQAAMLEDERKLIEATQRGHQEKQVLVCTVLYIRAKAKAGAEI
jgi:hypothetical protein